MTFVIENVQSVFADGSSPMAIARHFAEFPFEVREINVPAPQQAKAAVLDLTTATPLQRDNQV
ncbi:hypothetical protein NKL07_01395 [Mesorhizobium sp. C280B]|uniref:hypothetical protein n=1 Tax=unclassified Mesorhizobium TaxID=325217 RepID=UPI0003CE0D91|nr:hypothetical protein [Mesorhizobium sp. LSJC280B00]ESW66525.1 hypothetical protein X772_35035 [Mesorhizobium sp. LSJC280B00]